MSKQLIVLEYDERLYDEEGREWWLGEPGGELAWFGWHHSFERFAAAVRARFPEVEVALLAPGERLVP